MLRSIQWAALGTGFTFLMTTLGAAVVFFLTGEPKPRFQKTALGFAAGVMTAASVWSLLLPAIDQAAEAGRFPGWLPAAAGMLAGVVFSRGSCNRPPAAARGIIPPESLRRRYALRRCGADLRRSGGGACGLGAAPDALASQLRGGRHALCGGGGAGAPGSQPGRDLWICDRIFDHDGFRCCFGVKKRLVLLANYMV